MSRVLLISFNMAAMVVVLPMPVPPVTKMMPFFSLITSWNVGPMLSDLKSGISGLRWRNTMA